MCGGCIPNASPSRCQIISAQQLPKVNKKKSSIVDPLVIVEVFGVPADCAKKETDHVDNNGTVPGSVHLNLKAASFGAAVLPASPHEVVFFLPF